MVSTNSRSLGRARTEASTPESVPNVQSHQDQVRPAGKEEVARLRGDLADVDLFTEQLGQDIFNVAAAAFAAGLTPDPSTYSCMLEWPGLGGAGDRQSRHLRSRDPPAVSRPPASRSPQECSVCVRRGQGLP